MVMPERLASVVPSSPESSASAAARVVAAPVVALAERHPLAATIALRAMIDFTLREARSSRYGHAARHLAACARMAERIEDWRAIEAHEAYVARLRAEHGRKSGFWTRTA